MQNNKKVLTAIVFIVILAIGGYFVWNSTQRKYCWPYCPGMTDQDREEIKKSALDAETAKWGTVTDEPNGFEYKVPPSFNIDPPAVEGNGILVSFNNNSVPNHQSRIDVFIIPAKGATSFPEYQQKYPILDANSGKPLQFKTRIIGSNTFYYVRTERFEGTLSFVYEILHGGKIFGFSSTSQGVDWTNPNLDEENDSTHVTLRNILSTLKFTK